VVLLAGAVGKGLPSMKTQWLNDFSWADGEGGLHFDIPLMLRRLGHPDTPENRDRLTKLMEQILTEMKVTAVIKITE
jgi:hypothetical protein